MNRDAICQSCGHGGYSHFFNNMGELAECHESACKCVSFTTDPELPKPRRMAWCLMHDDQQYGDKPHYCGINWDGGAAAPCRMVPVTLTFGQPPPL